MLMNQLFQGIQSTNDRLEEKIILPNLTGGYDLRDRSGEVIAAYQPSPVGEGGIIMDGHGETIARVQGNVYDGTTFDFGDGHTVTSTQNIYAGENFHDNFEGVIGYSQPNSSGGITMNTATGEKLYDVNSNPLGEGMTIDTSPEFISANIDIGAIDTTHLDALDVVNNAVDITDAGSILSASADGLDIFDLLGNLF
ncbi:hypothetical protein CN907_01685 [Bacillus anthracis]|uniref:Uncharacterized protein n=1 Tax=Bacillus fungorum TaxID=2039284 RepID=A0A2G6QCL9_9BACI|nr:hypothetical protein [Bacillus fungorum]PGK47555.1 hypothetical protein CN907_01685 [Bacillus anthracis]PIE94491.1 hypothetical protein CO726_15125 [Bacillus fungorum]